MGLGMRSRMWFTASVLLVTLLVDAAQGKVVRVFCHHVYNLHPARHAFDLVHHCAKNECAESTNNGRPITRWNISCYVNIQYSVIHNDGVVQCLSLSFGPIGVLRVLVIDKSWDKKDMFLCWHRKHAWIHWLQCAPLIVTVQTRTSNHTVRTSHKTHASYRITIEMFAEGCYWKRLNTPLICLHKH